MYPIDSVFILSCIYVPILILLYVLEIWTVLKPKSPFRGTFYILFVAGAIADLIMVAATTHELRLVFFPLVNGFFETYDCDACAQMRIGFSYICPFTQDLLNTFIALNRYTSISLPVGHARLWKYLLPTSIIGTVCLAFLLFGVAFSRKVFYTRRDLGEYPMYFTMEDLSTIAPWHNTHRVMSIEMITTSIIIIILYTMAARALGKLTSDSGTKKQERKLLIFGMINFALQLLAMFPQLMLDFNFFPIEWIIVVVYQFCWLTDIKCFCVAVTMIVVNTTFRAHMIESFGLKRFMRRRNKNDLMRLFPIDAVFLLDCIYVPLLILLYILEISTILKPKSPFKGSFYILFLERLRPRHGSVYDARISTRLLSAGQWIETYECDTCAQLRAGFACICPFTQDLTNPFIALNRFTSIRLPVDHARIWKYLLPLSIIGTTVVAFLLFSVAFFRKVRYTRQDLDEYPMYYNTIEDQRTIAPWVVFSKVRRVGKICSALLVISHHSGEYATTKQERKLLIFGIVNLGFSPVGISAGHTRLQFLPTRLDYCGRLSALFRLGHYYGYRKHDVSNTHDRIVLTEAIDETESQDDHRLERRTSKTTVIYYFYTNPMLYPIDSLFLLSCIYVPFLILLYLLEIWTVLKPKSPFKGSFYYLFVAGAFADLVMICATCHELRLVFFPLVNGFFATYDCDVCARIRIAFSYICPFTQDLLNTCIALNRFTSVGMPMAHARLPFVNTFQTQQITSPTIIWNILLPVSIIGTVLLAFLLFGVAFSRKVLYTPQNLGQYSMYFTREDLSTIAPWYNTHRVMSVEMITSSIMIIVLYTLAARALRKLTSDSATKKQERKLLIFGMVNFGLQLLAMFPQVMLDFNFFPMEWIIVVVYQYTWLTDVKCFCSAVTMIVVNTTFRTHMIESFGLDRFMRRISKRANNSASITPVRRIWATTYFDNVIYSVSRHSDAAYRLCFPCIVHLRASPGTLVFSRDLDHSKGKIMISILKNKLSHFRSMHPINVILIASCIYVPTLTLLFLAEIWTVLKPGSPFKSSFYILFVAGAIVDIFTICADMYELRLIFFPLATDRACNGNVCYYIHATYTFDIVASRAFLSVKLRLLLQMHLSVIFLLSIIALSSTAPTTTTVDHELAAKQFFGSLFEKIKNQKFDEVFDQLFAKWEHLYPEMITKEQAKEIRAVFMEAVEKGRQAGKGVPKLNAALFVKLSANIGQIQEEVQRRIGKLNDEGETFIRKAFASFPQELSPLTEKFDAFRSEFESLSPSTQKKLAKQFVIFAHLDEVKGFVTVYDRLIGAVQTACDNLLEFELCEQIAMKE
uniref:Serpentine receptor class gamma n=1 Tax=Pristionchus pacificus TaxID=54126 RepID=A0A8R1UYM6_PRIPA